jgi:hypothetical protein
MLFKNWTKRKRNFVQKINSLLPLPADHDEFHYEKHKLALKQTPWCELTKSKMEELFESKLSWAEYDLFFGPFYGGCKFYLDQKDQNPEHGESPASFYLRNITKMIKVCCNLLNIDMEEHKDIINEAIALQHECAMFPINFQKAREKCLD